MSFPALTPTQHTKALWVGGVLMVALVVGFVMELAAPPTTEDEDREFARQKLGKRRRWEPDALRKLRAIKRVGDRMTRTYNGVRR